VEPEVRSLREKIGTGVPPDRFDSALTRRNDMKVTVTRRGEASDADVLIELCTDGFAAEAKDYSPGKTEPHHHDYDVCLQIFQGELRLNLPDEGRPLSCQPGDRVFVPAGTIHSEEHGHLRMVVGRRRLQPAQGSDSGRQA
jgi:mannose-6-phosphate isomerase-like protein (cupin superfamily)